MSKDFFTVIGEQLCSIKNSPFAMFSAQSNHDIDIVNNNSHLRKSVHLHYDPNRLFNPDKYKQQHKQDPDFIQFQKDQKQNLQRIQITFLKQKTQEQLRKLQQKTQFLKDQTFIHPYSIFKVDRSVCMSCNKCFEYNGNFNIGSQIKHSDSQKTIQYLCCLTCSCPMNSHSVVPYSNKFSKQIFKYLTQKIIATDQINYKFFPLCFIKPKQSSYQILMNNFQNYLPQLGFHIISSKVYSLKQFQMFQIKRQILTGVDKQTVQKLMVFASFLQKQNFKWQEDLPEQVDKTQFQIIKKLKDKVKVNQYLKKSDQILIFYVKNINQIDFYETTNILNHYSHYFQSSFLWMPKQPRQMFLTSCLLFPQHFTLNHQIFVLPSQKSQYQTEKVNFRFKDLLDYNNYTIIGQINKIQREKLESILKYQNFNKVNYIMGEQQMNPMLKRVRIQLSAKVGPSIFTIPFKNAVDFIQISSSDKKSPFMMAFPQYLRSQRCMIILRPCFTLANFDQIIMTLLRLNKFVLLKRRHVILNEQQARYLATLQKISQQNLESYIKMMTSGVSQIVLVSKRGAIYEANILLNGSKYSLSDTKIKTIKQLPLIKFKRGTESFEYTPTIKPYQNQKLLAFSSINQLFRLQNILFPQQNTQTRFMTNQKNGDIVKIDISESKVQQLKISSKMKQNMLNQIKKDSFNYWAFSSKSQLLTEQLAGIFMPQTTLFQSCVVIIKPGFIHLIQKIKQALIQHRYHVIMQKTVLLSKVLATQMIMNLQKVRTPKHDLKRFIETYSNQKIHLFCISKVYAKHEIFSILSQFSFDSSISSIVTDYIDDDMLKQVLIPVWNNQQFVLKILSPPLYNIQEAVNSLFKPIKDNDKFQILKYLIGSYYGVNIEDHNLNSLIGRFSYYSTNSMVANLQSWFYSQLSKLNPRYVPTLFQHRQIGQVCFVIQSFYGYPFLSLISTQYDQQKSKLKQINNKQQRKSLSLFLWGKQLAKFIYSISEKSAPLKGWGRISKKNDQWQGQISQREIYRVQLQFLEQCLAKFQDSQQQIHMNIKKLSESRFLTQKFQSNKNRKLIPYFIQGKIEQCLRIVQTQQVSKLHLVDKYSMIDPDHQKNKQKNLYTLNLFNVEPSIGTRQQLIVDLMIFLLKIERQSTEYSQMFSLLFQYFVQNILQFAQADQIQSQFYLRLLKQYISTSQNWIKTKLKTYPNLKKLVISKQSHNDQISGKKRKYIEKKQYYIDKHNNLSEEQKQIRQKQYKNFNLNYQAQQKQFEKNNPLLNLDDPLHKKFALQQKNITLLRQGQKHASQKTGIYVQYEKKISENQQLLMTKIKGQVDKFNLNKQQKILYQTGLQNQLWYRKTKGQKVQNKASKVDDAIIKQISKFIMFKQGIQKQKSEKDFYQTK